MTFSQNEEASPSEEKAQMKLEKLKSVLLTLGYIIGSILFLLGSILFHPYFYSIGHCYLVGVLSFIVGSAFFWFGSIRELQVILDGLKPVSINESTSLVNENPKVKIPEFNESTAISLIRTTVAFMSGILYIVGSFAFHPAFLPKGPLIGNWIFRIGSFSGFFSGMWKLYRLFSQEKKASHISIFRCLVLSNTLGSLLYVIGGFYFMLHYGALGSYIWSAGSVFFLIGSILILFL